MKNNLHRDNVSSRIDSSNIINNNNSTNNTTSLPADFNFAVVGDRRCIGDVLLIQT
jgi:hypothetical protein